MASKPSERIDWFEKLAVDLGVTLTPDMRAARAFLEFQGKRFLVDFGYDNVIASVPCEWRTERIH